MERTQEQKKAIALKGCNILVSAAAGSGKTSVLVERMFNLITKENPVDIDRLLVVTFTNAAAAEMRERMERILEERFQEHPEDKNLQKQMALLRHCHIMTIDSFCAEVLRNHFQLIELDPSFRIADQAELKLMKEDVLEKLLEEEYEKGEEGFLQLADSYAPGRSDENIEEMILSLYEAAAAYPDPDQWLEERREEIRGCLSVPLEEQAWVKKLLRYLRAELAGCKQEAERLIFVCENAGLESYRETLGKDLRLLEGLLSKEGYEELAEAFDKTAFARLARVKAEEKEAAGQELIEEVKKGRDSLKKLVMSVKESYFPELPEGQETGAGKEVLRELEGIRKPMLALLDLAGKFKEAYAEEKKERNVLDFSDQEHFAFRLLADAEGNPTKAALELREYFEEILIDEYQDSNRLQEAILTAVSRGKNLFMVGDVKQSIYKFRLAVPELFMEKYRTYSDTDIEHTDGKPEADSIRIHLSRNFRSRKTVLDTVNFLFYRIMGKQFGRIAYDEKAALYPGKDGEEAGERSELLLVTRTKEEKPDGRKEQERDKIELEAAVIAARIQQLAQEGVSYGDMAILLRTMSGWSEVFLKVLQEAGIPAAAATSKGYFEALEIKTLLNLCKLISNEQQDIPLAAVMLSPIGKFREEELALIRGRRGGSLYTACRQFLEEDGEEGLRKKLREFFGQIGYFRDLASCLPVPELLEQILLVTKYDSCMYAMPDGEKRYGNIRFLIKKAEDFEKTSYHGLFQFNRYIERIKKYEIDFGEAQSPSGMDAVQIMSIHKSKGLEFPVVFLAGLGKQFNLTDTRKNLVIHPQLGPGPDLVDLETGSQVPTVLKRALQKDMTVETLAEELRVLYVAMTRAEKKLIMTGFTDKLSENGKKWRQQGSAGKLPFPVLSSARTFLDMIMPVFLCAGSSRASDSPVFSSCPVDIREEGSSGLLLQAAGSEMSRERKHQELLYYMGKEPEEETKRQYRKMLSEMEFSYPYQEAVELKTKFTVSELKKAQADPEEDFDYRKDLEELSGSRKENRKPYGRALPVPDTDTLLSSAEEEETEPLLPSFLRKEERKEEGGAVLGTIYHKVMQRLDFTKAGTLKELRQQLNALEAAGILPGEEKRRIKPEKIWNFVSGAMGKRIAKAQEAGKLYREQPFVMGKAAEIFRKEGNFPEDEMVLVQGVIDLFFEEDEKLVLLDYKTDRVKEAEELRRRYPKQLDYYAEALERARNLPVKEKYFYSFSLEEYVPC